MNMYDVVNTTGSGFWVCAESRERALEIAQMMGHIKNKNKAKVHNVTKDALLKDTTKTLTPILAGTKEGQLIYELTPLSAQDIFSKATRGKNIKKKDIGWILKPINGGR